METQAVAYHQDCVMSRHRFFVAPEGTKGGTFIMEIRDKTEDDVTSQAGDWEEAETAIASAAGDDDWIICTLEDMERDEELTKESQLDVCETRRKERQEPSSNVSCTRSDYRDQEELSEPQRDFLPMTILVDGDQCLNPRSVADVWRHFEKSSSFKLVARYVYVQEKKMQARGSEALRDMISSQGGELIEVKKKPDEKDEATDLVDKAIELHIRRTERLMGGMENSDMNYAVVSTDKFYARIFREIAEKRRANNKGVKLFQVAHATNKKSRKTYEDAGAVVLTMREINGR